MENASKALLIAAGILIGLILISMVLYGYNQISSYYNAKESNKQIMQMTEFNKQYISYNRDDVRGSDLLSLINKIVDFNAINTEQEPIEITIKIRKGSQGFNYIFDESKNKNINSKIWIDTSRDIVYTANSNDEEGISRLISIANEIEATYPQGVATKLSANISTLMYGNSLKDPEDLLSQLKINEAQYGGLKTIQEDILQYYQYQQFKRAHFDCTNLIYDINGRVKSFDFEFNGIFE